MSIYHGQRRATLQNIVERIETICRAHLGIADFDNGNIKVFGEPNYKYPLAFLEDIIFIEEGEKKVTQTYTVTLNIVDLQPASDDRQAKTQVRDKVFETYNEVKNQLEQEKYPSFGNKRVSPGTLVMTDEFSKGRAIQCQGTFTINCDAVVTPAQDLPSIFPSLYANT